MKDPTMLFSSCLVRHSAKLFLFRYMLTMVTCINNVEMKIF